MDSSFSQLHRRETGKPYLVCVCVCVCIVFTYLKAVSCVVLPQSYVPLKHTHIHTPEAMLVNLLCRNGSVCVCACLHEDE